jgi:hypothetical protein
MTMNAKMLAVGVALATSLVAASPASALVISKDLMGGTGTGNTFTPAFTLGTIPAEFLFENKPHCAGVKNGCTYDFIFHLSGLGSGDTTTLQLAAQAQMGNPGHAVAENISFDVFSGAPGASASLPSDGNFLGFSDNTSPTAPVITLSLGNGDYFLQISASQVAVSGEASSGSLTETATVPEPASWSLMLLGVSALGATLRRKRLAATAA